MCLRLNLASIPAVAFSILSKKVKNTVPYCRGCVAQWRRGKNEKGTPRVLTDFFPLRKKENYLGFQSVNHVVSRPENLVFTICYVDLRHEVQSLFLEHGFIVSEQVLVWNPLKETVSPIVTHFRIA